MQRRPRSKPGSTETPLWRVEEGRAERRTDRVATEEPLEVRLAWAGGWRTVAVTMRTPGADPDLALGFLYAEGVVRDRGEVEAVVHPVDGDPNVIEVALATGREPELASLERHFFTSSACGVCGKVALEGLSLRLPGPLPAGPELAPELICSLPGKLRRAQGLFAATGGLHAAGLFDAAGELLALREDVGRHNALDKLVGWALSEGRLPLHGHLVMVSGRTSYEILQKSLVAGVPVIAAVSAPSSLAVELAGRFGLTLLGFVRGDRFNVYSGAGRIQGVGASARRPLPVILTSS